VPADEPDAGRERPVEGVKAVGAEALDGLERRPCILEQSRHVDRLTRGRKGPQILRPTREHVDDAVMV
jgi:hypothetical protein